METTRKLLEDARVERATAVRRSEELSEVVAKLRSELGTVRGQLEVERLAASAVRAQQEVAERKLEAEVMAKAALEVARDSALAQVEAKSRDLAETASDLAKLREDKDAKLRALETELEHLRGPRDAIYEDGMNAGLELIASLLEAAHPEWNIREELDRLISAQTDPPPSSSNVLAPGEETSAAILDPPPPPPSADV